MRPTPKSSLANLGFKLFIPNRVLRPFIRSYWYFCRDEPLTTCQQEFMHPTGGYGLVFNLGDALQLDAQPVTESVFLDGANTVSRKMGFWGRVTVMGVRFREGGAYPFLGLPLSELQNESLVLDVLKGTGVSDLQAQIQEARTRSAQIKLLEEWLIGRLSLGKERNAIIPASLTLLKNEAWQGSIPELAQTLAISQRQLERLYKDQVGMSPKQYAQLLRVERARLTIKRLHGQTTTRVGSDLGYYDQSHFIREFRRVIGMTPYAYWMRHHK